jgi:hypothetical protein
MAWERITWQGQDLVSGPAGAYVFLYTSGGPFQTAPEIFVKSEVAGPLVVARGDARAVTLVDGGGSRCRALGEVLFEGRGEQTVIEATAEMARYWVRMRFA